MPNVVKGSKQEKMVVVPYRPRQRLVFTMRPYDAELAQIPTGQPVAVFGLTMAMEDVLVRGPFMGTRRSRGVQLGMVDIDWVYNSMPPCHGQIYPQQALTPVVDF